MKKYEKFSNDLKDFIERYYVETYSTTKVVAEVKRKYDSSIGRNPIVDYLKSIGVYEGINGPNYLKKKNENLVSLMQDKYGISNWSQKGGGFKNQNKIPYKTLNFSKDYTAYKEKVEKLTKRNVRKLKKHNMIPDYCEYTGVLFADVEGIVNPNDPRKRTIDHKKPILICFLEDWPVEKTASDFNIKFVVKLVNSIKSNTEFDSFKKIIPKIKQVFIDEGYKSN